MWMTVSDGPNGYEGQCRQERQSVLCQPRNAVRVDLGMKANVQIDPRDLTFP